MNALFVCSKNKWRSPTAERIFRNDSRFAVRSCGLSKQAVRTITHKDVDWADVIFVMEAEHKSRLRQSFRRELNDTIVDCLDIPDDYQFMDPELVELLTDRINERLSQLQEDEDLDEDLPND
ncbi:MAG: phosphotyrosine protein phosphatase [Fuerstiella sp.]